MKAPRLFLVDDDETVRYGYKRYFANSEYQTMFAGTLKEAKGIMASERFDAMLLDLGLPDGDSIEWIPELRISHPGMPIIIITGTNDITTAVKAIKYGAENFLTKPVAMDNLKIILDRCIELGYVRKRDLIQQRLVNEALPYFGKSESTVHFLEQAKIAAAGDTVVLLLGETGTGKGVLARWIHNNCERKSDPFIEVNCAMLKGDLLRSELFGHARGAFTSAVAAKEGLIELADGGTLFLDEIADMDLAAQAQLLKTIEEKSFRRIGDNTLRKSDFKLICATHRDLKAETKEFRRDLYYRICTFPIKLPSLRQQKEEIPGLSEYFLGNLGYKHFPVDYEVTGLLADYPWPGNTRELKNVLERALLLAQGEPLSSLHFPDLSADVANEESQKLENAEDAHILQVLEKFNGDKRKTCKALGISISSLYRRLARIVDSQQTRLK
jgi:Response regulator containing CheY-like receiver, AAA-type ATPase, and DNA-binding domains